MAKYSERCEKVDSSVVSVSFGSIDVVKVWSGAVDKTSGTLVIERLLFHEPFSWRSLCTSLPSWMSPVKSALVARPFMLSLRLLICRSISKCAARSNSLVRRSILARLDSKSFSAAFLSKLMAHCLCDRENANICLYERHTDKPDLSSVDWLQGAEIVYTLGIMRKTGDPNDETTRRDGYYLQKKPFQIDTAQVDCAGRADVESSQSRQGAQKSPVLEVVQYAVDSRYHRLSKPRSLQLCDLQISIIGKTEIVIHSRSLIRALRPLIKYYLDYSDERSQSPMAIDEPYEVLMHPFRGIENYAGSSNMSAQQSEPQV